MNTKKNSYLFKDCLKNFQSTEVGISGCIFTQDTIQCPYCGYITDTFYHTKYGDKCEKCIEEIKKE